MTGLTIHEVSETIRQIWQHTLAVDNIGLQEDFWEMGGDSLLGVMIIAQVTYRFRLPEGAIDLAAVAEGITVSRMTDEVWALLDRD